MTVADPEVTLHKGQTIVKTTIIVTETFDYNEDLIPNLTNTVQAQRNDVQPLCEAFEKQNGE